jgi:tetratricopeptide (TPR) repeat protein
MSRLRIRRSFTLPAFALLLALPAGRLAAQDGPANQALDQADENAQEHGPDTLNTKQQARMHLAGGNRAVAVAEKFDKKAAATTDEARQKEFRDKAKASFEEAIQEYQAAIKQDPALVDAWVGLANLMLKSAHYDQAVATFDRALALDKKSTAALVGKGRAYLATFKVNEAKAVYEELAVESAKAAKEYLAEFRAWLEARRAKFGPDMAQAVAELDAWLAEREKK